MKFNDRRSFLKIGSAGVASMAATPFLAHATEVNRSRKIPENLTVVLQGDSITDAGRNKSSLGINDAAGLGRGYAFQIATGMLGSQPKANLQFYNRGISGNKVFQLSDRWDKDCLDLKPDVLSILIGVNDFWHSLKDYDGTAEVYDADLRKLLDRTLKALPNVKLIIGEPFAVKGGKAINDKWYPDFPKYQKYASAIANDYNAQFIPFQQVFDDALKVAPVSYWCPDGVHPSMAGAYLMKEAWVKAFEKLY